MRKTKEQTLVIMMEYQIDNKLEILPIKKKF